MSDAEFDPYLDVTCPTCLNSRGVTAGGAPSWLNAGNCPDCATLRYDGQFPLSFLGRAGRVRSVGDGTGDCEVHPGPDGEWLRIPRGDFIHRDVRGWFTTHGAPIEANS